MQDIIAVRKSMLQKVLTIFIVTLLFATVGLYIGQYVPPTLMMPLALAEVGMILLAFLLRRKKAVGYPFLYAFAVISGITTFPIVDHYATIAGAQVVLLAFGTTLVIFTVMGVIGANTKRDLSFIANFLLVALLALIVIGIYSIFSPLTSSAMLAFSAIGSIVFSLFIVYDFNKMKHINITEEIIPMLVLNLYLDFINLFINILQILGIVNSRD